jgi:DNA-binding transcriptional LysR family regulator
MALWASPRYLKRRGIPTSPDALAAHDLIQLTPLGDRVRLKSDAGRTIEIDFSGRLASDDPDNLKGFIQRGNGIGLLPDFVGVCDTARTLLTRILPEYGSETVTAYFVYPAQRFVPQVIRAFIARATREAFDAA